MMSPAILSRRSTACSAPLAILRAALRTPRGSVWTAAITPAAPTAAPTPSPTAAPAVPQTGDPAPISLWLVLALGSAAAVLALIGLKVWQRRRK